jgi:hypothetical protein
LVEVKVVNESPPQKFNPPLTDLQAPIHVQASEHFSAPLFLFSDPPNVSGHSVSSSVVDLSIPSTKGTGGILVMSKLNYIRTIVPTPFIHFSTHPSMWGTMVVSAFPSISIPSDHIHIPSIFSSYFEYFSSGGPSLDFIMGGGIPSTSTIHMSSMTSSSVGVPFGWNILSGFGVVSSEVGATTMLGGFKFPWFRTPFPRGRPL